MTIYVLNTWLTLFAGTDEEREVRGQIAITGYEPESLGNGLHPDYPEEFEFEVRCNRGAHRPDWYDAIEDSQYDRLTQEAIVAWREECREEAAAFCQ